MFTLLRLVCPLCRKTSQFVLPTNDDTFECPHCCAEVASIDVYEQGGYVYVLSNPSIPGIVKIGMTERDVPARALELSASTGVPEPYDVDA